MKEIELCVDPNFKGDLPYRSMEDDKWEWIGNNMIETSFPMQIDLELNTDCNFNCSMCFRDSITLKNEQMPLTKAFEVLDQCEGKLESMKVQYRGEPLLYPYLTTVIDVAKSFGIYVHFNTNASLLNKNMIRDLLTTGVDRIICSIESSIPKVYESIRRGGDFFKIVNNMSQLKYFRALYGVNTEIEILATKSDLNKKELENGLFRDFWGKYVDSIQIADCFDMMDNEQSYRILPDWHCGQPWQRLIVLVNGNVLPCCCGIDYKNHIVYKVGNVNETSIEKIWKGKKMRKLRKLHKEGKSDLIEMCRKCRIRKLVIKMLRVKE